MNRLIPLSVILLCAATPVRAADQAERPTTISLGLSADSLGRGYDNWTESALRARHVFAPRKAAEIGVARARRFGLSDSQLSGAVVLPLADKLTGSVEASYSADHRFLPRRHLGGSLQYEFAKGWLVQGGLAATRYDVANVKQSSLGLEHYVSDFSAGLSYRQTRVLGVSADGYALNGAWYYGERDSIGLTLATGREANSVPGGVQLGKVNAVALIGRHAVSPAWSVNYALSHTSQKDLYTRKGVSLGMAYSY